MLSLQRNKYAFIGMSIVGLSALMASFGYPLQRLEVWRITSVGLFSNATSQILIFKEGQTIRPLGFEESDPERIGGIYRGYKWEKLAFLAVAAGCGTTGLVLGGKIINQLEVEQSVTDIRLVGQRELREAEIKHRMAMAAKSQQLLFVDEVNSLNEEFGSPEEEMLEVDEINALYENPEAVVEESEDFRAIFPEGMDGASSKAIQKAMGDGLSQEEIVRDVLGCGKSQFDMGVSYYEWLKNKGLISE